MTFSGSTTVLDPPGAVDKGLVKGSFLVPTANDITGLQQLLAMTDPPFTPADFNSTARTLITFNGVTRPVTLADLASGSDESAPFVRASEAGMVGDGITDDAFALQQDIDIRAQTGGAVYFLRCSVPGAAFYFASTVRATSNIVLLFSSPVLLAKRATLAIRGFRSTQANKNAFRLSASAAQGATTLSIDTSPHGGGSVSTYFKIDDQLLIFGDRDGTGNSFQQQELRVTAVNDGSSQLTVAQALNAVYPITYPAGAYEANFGVPDYTLVQNLIIARGAADVLAGTNLIPINPADAGIIVAGDVVLLKDDTTCADVSGVVGGSTAPTGEDLAVVVTSAPGDPATSLRLDRRTSRDFSLARKFRVVRLNAATGSIISGARLLSAEAPDLAPAPRVPWFQQEYARGCVFDGCSVPNTDLFGKRGDAFQSYRCLEPRYFNCAAAKARYVDDGEGNGVVFDRSTGGKVLGGTFDSMRHATQCVGGSGHNFHDVSIINPRHTPVDCHGTAEVDCHWHDCTLTAGTQYEAADGVSPPAITFGNPTFLAGPYRCGFHGGSIIGFKTNINNIEGAIKLIPGSRNCVIDTTFDDITQLFEYRDLPGLGTQISSGHRIRANVDGCENTRLIDIQSRANGASIDTLQDIRLEIYGRRLHGGIYIINATEIEIVNCDVDEVELDPSAVYFIEAQNCTNLKVITNRTANYTRFMRMNGCVNYRVIGNRVLDQLQTTMLFDAGGNSGVWFNNDAVGFTPFWTHDPTSTITVEGRLPGQFDLADDSVMILKSTYLKGIATFFSTSGASFFANFFYDLVTPLIDLGMFSTALVNGSTVALAGTTGTDGRITVSAAGADDSIRIENRSGSTVRVSGRIE